MTLSQPGKAVAAGLQTAKKSLHLHFDVISHRALLSVGGKDYLLPDTYDTKELAQAAAQKFAWDKLGYQESSGAHARAADLPVWLH